MTVDLANLIGKTVERTAYQTVVFTDGTVLVWDERGCEAIYTPEEWKELNARKEWKKLNAWPTGYSN